MNDISHADQERINAFEMPFVPEGTNVIWHPQGVPNRQRRTVGTVVRANARSVDLRLANGRLIENSRYVDDPKLELNADQRENGAWEYTQEYLEMQDLRRRVSLLEEALTGRAKQEESETLSRDEKGQQKLDTLIREGHSPDYIFKRVRSYGITQDMIAARRDELLQQA